MAAEFIQNKEQNEKNDDDLNRHDDLGGSGSKLIPGFRSGVNDTAGLGVTEAKYIKVLSAALVARGGDNTLLTATYVFFTRFTSKKLKSLIINFVEVAIFTPATSGTIGTGETTGKGVVAEKVDDIRDGCHGALS